MRGHGSEMDAPRIEEGVRAEEQRVGTSAHQCRECDVDVAAVLALRICSCTPMLWAAACTSLRTAWRSATAKQVDEVAPSYT